MSVETVARGSTQRVRALNEELHRHAIQDRTGEWFDEPGTVVKKEWQRRDGKEYEDIIVRRALAFQAMLEQLTIPDAERTGSPKRTYEIVPGELIVGICPLGSLGIGGAFPEFMTEDEQRVGFVTSQDHVGSVIGHNVVNYTQVMTTGLRGIIEECDRRLESLLTAVDAPNTPTFDRIASKRSFFRAVKICCEAVVAYANRFGDLAEEEASKHPDRADELREVARICHKVPYEPPDSFHEALQSIWFMHVAMHATIDRMSFGRLDQVLQPFYETSRDQGMTDEQAQELIECFLIKGAGPLNYDVSTYEALDHNDYGAIVNAQPDLIDFRIDINNFWQQMVVGGKDKTGKDATNDCTYLFLDAYASCGAVSPVLYARVHRGSPKAYLERIAHTLRESGTNQPILYNDDVIIPALSGLSEFPEEYSNDYAADGCWEPVPQGVTDWTLGIVTLPQALECALNSGALITDDPEFLRGEPISTQTPRVDDNTSFDDLKEYVIRHMRNSIDKLVLSFYMYYLIPGASSPVPFYSALTEGCMEKGRDKTWAGPTFVLAGVLAAGLPNLVNSLASIYEWVYRRKVYTLPDVLTILRANYQGYEQAFHEFLDAPKFGNVIPRETPREGNPNLLMKEILDEYYKAMTAADELARYVFLERVDAAEVEQPGRARRIWELRRLADYAGPSMRDIFGDDFRIRLSAGCGTFELYAFLGRGCAASPDGRRRGEPLAPNFSPTSGTLRDGLGSFLESLDALGLDRFGAGAMSDVCVSKDDAPEGYLVRILEEFVRKNGSILALNLVSTDELNRLYMLAEEVREGTKDHSVLDPYLGVTVRVGGFQTPFVTMTQEQQLDYLGRGVKT